jgi:hypothetical protein
METLSVPDGRLVSKVSGHRSSKSLVLSDSKISAIHPQELAPNMSAPWIYPRKNYVHLYTNPQGRWFAAHSSPENHPIAVRLVFGSRKQSYPFAIV